MLYVLKEVKTKRHTSNYMCIVLIKVYKTCLISILKLTNVVSNHKWQINSVRTEANNLTKY